MRTVKLTVHHRKTVPAEETVETEDLQLNKRDFPDFQIGEVVEIYHAENDFPRLLLQIGSRSFKEDYTHNSISVEDSIARTFHLRQYGDVIVNRVQLGDVELNLLELKIKDQYFSRSDMWRYRNRLEGTCAYLHKKTEFDFGKTVVHEMWAKGTRVACGYIGPNTRIAFRSMTANVYIFIQMSVEMWEFDFYGDLYFEKSVKGFLTELFDRWRAEGSNHDVTIVLFSRTFFEATSIDEFPCAMRKGLLQDYKGRFYEDYYRIVVQNEKYDDWTLVLMKLKALFHDYNDTVLNFHSRPGVKLPRAYNSTASEGNVLEVLNMALNVFEKHDIDRNFERTGQMSVVITPSTGVFEVDRELLMLTKQKSIDYGIGNDLVFMGEQPLHVVPLFILHNKLNASSSSKSSHESDDYAIPNWLNYSYYSSKEARPNKFVPRIHIPEKVLMELRKQSKGCKTPISRGGDMFKFSDNLPRPDRNLRQSRSRRTSETNLEVLEWKVTSKEIPPEEKAFIEKCSLRSCSLETTHPLRPNGPEKGTGMSKRKKPYSIRPLINPLAPSKIPGKLTSNRRRWVHLFPVDPTGAAVQTHHFRAVSNSEDVPEASRSPMSEKETTLQRRDTDSPRIPKGRRTFDDSTQIVGSIEDSVSVADEESPAIDLKSPQRTRNRIQELGRGSPAPSGSQTQLWALAKKKRNDMKIYSVWGITGEMEWTPNLTTGCDWKALTIPASLPITTDYLPDQRSLQRDFLISDYSVLPEEGPPVYESTRQRHESDPVSGRYYSRPLSLDELYEELILQRLQQGFQLITDKIDQPANQAKKESVPKKAPTSRKERYLSLGRVIHKLVLEQSSITVTRLHPKHVYKTPEIRYLYRFMVPDMARYEVSTVKFAHFPLESLNWNYVDFCVVNKGRGSEFKLEYTRKHWKSQYFLLPCQNYTIKSISEGSSRCDIYREQTREDYDRLCEGFMKIMEMTNRMKRPAVKRPGRNDKKSVVSRALHRDPALHSNPEIQSVPSTPRQDSGFHNSYMATDIAKVAANFGLEINPADLLSTSPRALLQIFSTSHRMILDSMRLPAENIVTAAPGNGLRANYFVSFEAVMWAMEALALPSIEIVVELFDKMRKEKLIIHASGRPEHPFVFGFYMYNIVDQDKPFIPPIVDSADDIVFDEVWFESALVNCGRFTKHHESFEDCHACLAQETRLMLSDITASHTSSSHNLNQRKTCVIDVDIYKKSTRLEWAIANYNATFIPKCPFSIEFKWIQACGPMFGELIQLWVRKVTACGFHLVPVSMDPFALPQKPHSDPMRMPIFVPLNLAALGATHRPLFFDFPEESRAARTVAFQEEILKRFGFISLQENSSRQNVNESSREYCHVSGGMFVMIPSRVQRESTADGTFSDLSDGDCGPSGDPAEIGFWWAWNSCLTKRWRSIYTGDEAFLDRMLADFRSFCSNHDNRLTDLWDEVQSTRTNKISMGAGEPVSGF